MTTTPVAGPAGRHPLDPDPVRSTKARAVFALGLVALLTGPLVGGVVPATVAMLLARQARREAYASGGYLTGAAWLDRGEWMAWAAVVLAATAAVVVTVIGVVTLADGSVGRDFAPGVD
ncbi:hypothetical protein ACN27G_25785 [Plantactinospora sp. WMMB334]|uniref:hypothetical protein n=1 Tax=Plantactinospora sp. WMMB334 TaxID=3404119 RepID=UPI003B9408BC